MQTLNTNQISDVMRRFPQFELSYETMSHRKVSFQDYPTCLAIPYGKKAYLWFTFFQDQNVCFLLELNREKCVGKVQVIRTGVPTSVALGTLLYGTLSECEQPAVQCFVIEDILHFHGRPLSKISFSEKLGFLNVLFRDYLHDFVGETRRSNSNGPGLAFGHSLAFGTGFALYAALPVLWPTECTTDQEQNEWIQRIPYTVHHYQYRSLHSIVPHINVQTVLPLLPDHSVSMYSSVDTAVKTIDPGFPLFIPPPLPRCDFAKPQYRYPTVFEIKADLQSDIYHLYVYGKSSHQSQQFDNRVYYGVAYIPNYKTSVFMNSLFRNIKENQNLDYAEESDDEDDFQDIRADKYVDLNKTVTMECTFHAKFKRWVPMRSVKTNKLVHISKL